MERVFENSHRIFRSVRKQGKYRRAQDDRAQENEKCFQHIEPAKRRNRNLCQQFLTPDSHSTDNHASEYDSVDEDPL